MRRKTISVIIPTLNCAVKLERCLRSVRWTDEIMVVDMGSIDATLVVAKKYKAKIYTRIPADGNFDWNRKYGMEQAKGDWVLKLDSDEVLTEELAKEIQKFLELDDFTFNGFNLKNKIFYFGQEVRHGFVKPDSHELRMVRQGYWHYEPVRYHQQITVIGKIGAFRGFYLHYNVDTISDFIDKTNKYTSLDAQILARETRLDLINVIIAPLKTFVKLYILQAGFLDGTLGLLVCCLYAYYNFILKAKIWEKQNL